MYIHVGTTALLVLEDRQCNRVCARMMPLGGQVQAIKHSVLHLVTDTLGCVAIQLLGRRGEGTCN